MGGRGVDPLSSGPSPAGEENVPFLPSGFFDWPNNSIDIRQTNRRKTFHFLSIPTHKIGNSKKGPEQPAFIPFG